MRYFACIVCTLSALALLGCAVTDPQGRPAGIPQLDPQETGIVFASIGVSKPTPYGSQGLVYRVPGSRSEGLIRYMDGWIATPVDFEYGSAKGSLFVARLPPGNYEISNVRFFLNNGLSTVTFSSRKDFSVPFSVKRGMATYLGEFLTYEVKGRNAFGMSVPAGGYFVVSNKLERDLAILEKKGSAIPHDRIEESVLNPEALGVPYFALRPKSF